MFKKRLFTPGPTPVPESVMLAMAQPITLKLSFPNAFIGNPERSGKNLDAGSRHAGMTFLFYFV